MIAPFVCWCCIGYLSGSVLYAQLLTRFLTGKDLRESGSDKNPGVANAFWVGGAGCGMASLFCELVKGYLPVHLALRHCDIASPLFALVLLAPVLGHAWPLFFRFRGGKGIAVSFGVLLGLWPVCWLPAIILAVFYLLFSLFLRIDPHSYRTAVTFACAAVTDFLLLPLRSVACGVLLFTAVVLRKHKFALNTERSRLDVHLFHHTGC